MNRCSVTGKPRHFAGKPNLIDLRVFYLSRHREWQEVHVLEIQIMKGSALIDHLTSATGLKVERKLPSRLSCPCLARPAAKSTSPPPSGICNATQSFVRGNGCGTATLHNAVFDPDRSDGGTMLVHASARAN